MRRSNRGVSTTVGAALMVAVILTAVAGVVMWGVVQTDDASERAQAAAVENEMEGLSDGVRSVALSDRDTQTVELKSKIESANSQTTVEPTAGHITVDVTGSPGTEVDRELGRVQFQRDDTTIAVQGGGVWRQSGNTTEVIQAPPFSTDSGSRKSVTLPIIQVTGEDSISRAAAIRMTQHREAYPDVFVPAGSAVEIRIQSEYAAAWARYFESSFPEATITHPAGNPDALLVQYSSADGFYLHLDVYSVNVAQQ